MSRDKLANLTRQLSCETLEGDKNDIYRRLIQVLQREFFYYINGQGF